MRDRTMTHASLCTGIGACELAATWMGWENLFSCEIDEFCNKVLKHHYPKAIHYGNIFEQDFREWRGRVDVLTAGFPCQPFSFAGKRNGAEDDRYLWPEVLRVISEVRPTWFIGENVGGIITMVLPGEETKVGSYTDICGENYTFYEKRQRYIIEQIRIDLASIGYSVQLVVIPACAVGAPHRRDRVWFLARRDDVTDTDGNGHSSRGESKESKECRCGNISQQEKRGNSTEWIDGLFRFSRFTPDTDGAGLQEAGAKQRATGVAGDGMQGITTNPSESGFQERVDDGKQEDAEKKRSRVDDRPERYGGEWAIADPHRELQECRNKQEQERRDTENIRVKPSFGQPTWENFPTQSPVRAKYDGISNIVPRYINQEVYDAIKEYIRREDLPSVWEAFQEKEIREKIGRLYEILEPDILLEILQRASKDERPEPGQEMLSCFSKETSERILCYLRKHGTFTSSPLGQKYQEQFTREFGDTMCDLSHEIALATKKIIEECEKTRSRWRQESIKALGNSMVPQVVHEIFKAIERVETIA